MKFRVSMKCPDALHEAVKEAVEESVDTSSVLGTLDGDEKDSIIESRIEKVRSLCSKWFKYGEYLEVEIDTEEATCVVVPCK